MKEVGQEVSSVVSISLTEAFYGNLYSAFEYFNKALFEGKLPACLITLRSANRFHGYHHAKRFIAKNGDLIDELGLNPGFFAIRSPEEALSTLVHEMVHHWQAHFGQGTHSNPHNKEWAAKMQEVGLMPSATGLPGGEKTGRNMTHYILPDGPFIHVCRELIASGFCFIWHDRFAPKEPESMQINLQKLAEHNLDIKPSAAPIQSIEAPKESRPAPGKPPQTVAVYSPPPKKASTRVKLVCTSCQTYVWANKEVKLVCGECDIPLVAIG